MVLNTEIERVTAERDRLWAALQAVPQALHDGAHWCECGGEVGVAVAKVLGVPPAEPAYNTDLRAVLETYAARGAEP